jgi:xanthine dehydrogenase small subunit
MSSPIRFYFRGQLHQIDASAPTRTVLQYLREEQHCTGSKEACAEGDCGACTVVLAERDGADGVRAQAVNACIQLLPALDGKALFTVEDLQQPDGSLHPVQQSLVDQHASQCGFCTPGFVMSLWAMYLRGAPNQTLERGVIEDALSGNLCRCTGYRPIIAAAQQMHHYPPVSHPALPTVSQLQALQRSAGWQYQPQSETPTAPHCLIPTTRAELGQLRQTHPDACLLAGATDIGLWLTKQLRQLPSLIYLGQVEYLKQVQNIEIDGAPWLEIGSMVNLNDAYGALTRHYPQQLGQFWQRFASHPIRNSGTLGGNLANGSPIGDSMPWLIALGAQLVLHRGENDQRSMALEDFYLAYQKKDLRPDEWVAAVRVPLPADGASSSTLFRTYKLSKRFDQDISAVCAGFALTVTGDRITSARIAYGGMAATPKRARAAEAVLTGAPWDEAHLNLAMAALAQDYQPLSDMRASSAYRLASAQQLLHRFWLETRPDAPLSPAQVNVFAQTGASA